MGTCASRPSVVPGAPTTKGTTTPAEHRAFVQDSCRFQGVSEGDRKASGTSTDGSDLNEMEPFDLTPRGKPGRQVDIKPTTAHNEAAVDALESSEASQSTELPAPVLGRRASAGTANEHTERPPPKGLADEPVAAMVEHIIGAPYDVFRWGPPKPPCDQARLQAVAQLPPVDAEADPGVDHIITLICQVFRVEAALLALFDDNRIFLRNAKGFQRGEFPWRWSFCAWCMATPQPEVLLVEDVDQDARFRDNEVANKMGVKFYCGSPVLGSSGHRLGTLCFTDSKPRKFKAEELVILANLAELVAREVERGAADQARKREQRHFMARALECFATPVAFVDVSLPGWRAMHCSPAFSTAIGITAEVAARSPLWGLLQTPTAGFNVPAAAADIAAAGNEFVLDGVTVCGAPERGSFSLRFKPAGRHAIDRHQLPVGIPAHVASGPSAAQQYFFVTLDPSGGARPLRQDSLASGLSASTAPGRTTSHSPSVGDGSQALATSSGSSMFSVSRGAAPTSVPFEGLALGPLVGSGSFGHVYRGTLHGETVAVKICQPLGKKRSAAATAAWATTEARASGRWSHPNIVRALKHCSVLTPVECESGLPSLTQPDSRLPSFTVPEDEEVTVAGRLDAPPPFIANPFSSARSQRNADPAALQALAAAAAAQAAQAKGPPALRLGAATAAAASPFVAAQNLVAAAATPVPPPAAGAPSFVSPFAAARVAAPAARHVEPRPGAVAFASPFAAQAVAPQRSAGSVAVAQAGGPSAAATARLCVPVKELPVDETRPLQTGASTGTTQVSGDSVAALSEAAMFVVACSPPSATSEDCGDLRAASGRSASGGGGRISTAAHPIQLVPFSAAPAPAPSVASAPHPRPAAPAAAAATGDADQGGPQFTATASGGNPHGEFGRSDSASTAMPPHRRAREQSAGDGSDSLRGGGSSRDSSRSSSLSGSGSGSGSAGSCLRGGAPPSPSTPDGRKTSLVQQAAGPRKAPSMSCGPGGRVAAAGEVETWLLLEYCDRGSLQGGVDRGWFRRERRTRSMGGSINVILSVARDICSAMAYLHREGIVHGDLAGGNVLLTSAATPHGFCAKVSDFGLAQQVGEEGRCAADSYGTVTHMPPEVLGGEPLHRSADVWSFGVLLWEMWCGVRAWAGLSVPQILTAVAIDRRSLQFPAGTPADFEMLATLCMAQKPEARPSFQDLQDALDKLIIRHINADP